MLAPASRPTEIPDPERVGGAGVSENIYIKVPDEKTGALSTEFRAKRFEPRKDGTVDVTEPEATFYLGAKTNTDGQKLVIRGKTGKVVVPDSANKRSQMRPGTAAAPTRGQLQDVTLFLYDSEASTEPTLVCTMNNASFDQETFRIQTESYERNGKIIPADQVEVQVRGRDYDFDGRGLDIRWNERDRRLQQLDIAHGEQLVVKHPQAIRTLGVPASQPSAHLMEASPLRAMLASADPASAGEAIPPRPAAPKKKKPATAPAVAPVKIVRDKSAPIFRATFLDNVKIVQADATLATANQMHVDFVMESARSTTEPSTKPATAPAAKAAPEKNSAEPKSLATVQRTAKKSPTTAPADKKAPKPRAQPTTAPSPTTQPEEQPVTIYWTGKLQVIPLDVETQDPPTRDNAIVTLEGEPVVLTRGGGQVDCSLMRYRTEDSSILLESSKLTPAVVMKDVNGSVLRTPSLDYNGTEGVAVLKGASHADLVMKNESTTQPAVEPQLMHASWTKSCRLYMQGEVRENMTIDRAEIEGDVTVDHPQVKGRSDTLELAFEQSPTTKPVSPGSNQPANELQLKQLDAEGKVHYVMASEQPATGAAAPKTQTIDCAHLMLATAKNDQNKFYARAMNADGDVHAFDDTQDLKCAQLALKFLPSTQPSTRPMDSSKFDTGAVVVESISAQQDVRISTADGNAASADQLVMETKDGKREITLIGQPVARVQQKENILTGPVIKFDPDTNRAYVVGAGTMHAVQQQASGADKKSKPQPIDMSWGGNLAADGNLNIIDISEKIALNARTPATQKVKKDKNSPMAQTGFGDTNFFKDKLVKTVQLQDNVQIASVLNDAEGKLLRRLFLRAPLVEYQMQDKNFVVPSAGQMLMEDESKSSSANGAASDTTGSDMHGPTAFGWHRELRYDENQRRMTMSGDVHIVHDSGGDSKPFTLSCQTVVADLEPATTTQPTTAPATQPIPTSPTNEKMRIKHVMAQDQVEFISLPVHFEATSIDYDPNTHILIAKGSDRVHAELYDDKGTVKGSFTELRYNTQTGQIEQTLGFRTTVRK
jgi:hypothetical protein